MYKNIQNRCLYYFSEFPRCRITFY